MFQSIMVTESLEESLLFLEQSVDNFLPKSMRKDIWPERNMSISKFSTAHSPDPKSNCFSLSFSFVLYSSLFFQWLSSAPERQALWKTMLYNSVWLAYCPVTAQTSPSLASCQRILAAHTGQLAQVSCRGEKPCCGFWITVTGLSSGCQGNIRSPPFTHTAVALWP